MRTNQPHPTFQRWVWLGSLDVWNDVVIGKGNKGNTSIQVFQIEGKHSISQNNATFWLGNCILGTGMTIFKDTDEGKELMAMIEARTPLPKIQHYLDSLILNHIDPEKLRQRIEVALAESYEKGRESKAADMREALGL